MKLNPIKLSFLAKILPRYNLRKKNYKRIRTRGCYFPRYTRVQTFYNFLKSTFLSRTHYKGVSSRYMGNLVKFSSLRKYCLHTKRVFFPQDAINGRQKLHTNSFFFLSRVTSSSSSLRIEVII